MIGMEQFYSDLRVANKTEAYIGKLFETEYNAKVLEYNDDNRYDLKIQASNGTIFTVEIKEDFSCARTGNLGIEYSCRGKDSGIVTTQADFYLIKAHRPNQQHEYVVIRVQKLREMIDKGMYHRKVNGGDPGSNSLNYLFYLETIKEHGEEMFKGL